MKKNCSHSDEAQRVGAGTAGCEECLETGGEWVALRICLTCGHVGCCDSSRGMHATKHFNSTSHKLMQSFEPRELWGWCYVDEATLEFNEKYYKET